MKKVLSVFIAVALVLSFATMFNAAPMSAPVAKAANETVTITKGPTPMKNLCGIDYPVVQYTMGDVIKGQVRGYDEALNPGTTADHRTHVYVIDNAGNVILKAPVDQAGGFSIETTTVVRDGDYYLYWAGYNDNDDAIGAAYSHPAGEVKYTYLSGGATRDAIYIKYVFIETSPASLRYDCLSHVFSGWVKTGGTSTTTTRGVQVHVIMPDGSEAPGSPVSVGEDGEWSLSVQINQKGTYTVWLDESPNAGDDTYPSYGTCKKIVYYTVTTGAMSINIIPVVKPTILYASGQPQQFAVYVLDQDGDPVTGIPAAAWTVSGFTGAPTITEPFDGVYLFQGTPAGPGSISVGLINYDYLGTLVSGSTIVTVKAPSAFNPYVTIWGQKTYKYQLGNDNGVCETVYEKFPCTPGNWIGLITGLADLDGNGKEVADPSKDTIWEARSWVSGPVERLTWNTAYPGNNRWVGKTTMMPSYGPNHGWMYLVTGQGTIKVTVKAKIHEKAAGDCEWDPQTPDASRDNLQDIDSDPNSWMNNSCCIEKEQTFTICTIHDCKVEITSSKSQSVPQPKVHPAKVGNEVITPDAVSKTQLYLTVGDTTDLKFALTQDPESPVQCACNIIIHLKACGPTAGRDMFKLADGEVTDEIWYNPAGKIPVGYTTAPQTTDPFDWTSSGGVVTLKGVTVQHSAYWWERLGMGMTNVSSGILVEVYGQYMKTCPVETVYPKIFYDPIAIEVLPKVTNMSTKILNSQVTDPKEMVAGVSEVLQMSGFDPASGVYDYVDEGWTSGEWLNNTYYSVSDLGSGVYQTTISPAFDRAGTFYFDLYSNDGDSIGEATVKVVKPKFDIKIVTSSGKTIDNDNTITEGVVEGIQFTAVDPRDETIQLTPTKAFAIPTGIGDAFYGTPIPMGYFAYDLDYPSDDWPVGSCGLPSSFVYNANVCGGCSPLKVIALDNPNVDDPPQIMVMWQRDGANVVMNIFDVVAPTITVSPDKDIPFYGCATCGQGTDITFTALDAHSEPLVGAQVVLSSDVAPQNANVNWTDQILTGTDGKIVYHFNPPFAGMFYATLNTDAEDYTWPNCEHDWLSGRKDSFESRIMQVFTTVYKAPEKDTEAPKITITAPEDGATVDTDMVKVEGTVTDNVGVASLYIGTQKIDFAPDGSFAAEVQLDEGKNTIKVFAFDAAGNKAEKDITVTYQKPAPVKKTVVTVQIGSDVMTVNGQVYQLDVAPVIHDGHTYLPLRAIAEALGAKVDWIASTKGITLTLGKHTVGLQIGNATAVVDGNVVAIFPPYLQPYGDGTYAATMVPLRVIAEGLGATVNWDPATRTITITLVQSGD